MPRVVLRKMKSVYRNAQALDKTTTKVPSLLANKVVLRAGVARMPRIRAAMGAASEAGPQLGAATGDANGKEKSPG